MNMENFDLVDLIEKGYRVYMLKYFNFIPKKEYLKLKQFPNLIFIKDKYEKKK